MAFTLAHFKEAHYSLTLSASGLFTLLNTHAHLFVPTYPQTNTQECDSVSPRRQQIKRLTFSSDTEPAPEYCIKFYRQYQVPYPRLQLYEVSQKY